MKAQATRDESKLPVWAQDRINRAERERDEALRKLAQIFSAEASNTQWEDGREPARNLPNDARIAFTVNGNRISVRVRGDVLDVNTNTGSVAVIPRASNAFQMKVLDR